MKIKLIVKSSLVVCSGISPINLSNISLLLWSKYSARSAHYLGMIFVTRERIALLESKWMLLKRGMGNGEWGMGNGEWGMGNGEWGMGNGEWGMANGEWGMGNGEWEIVVSG